MQNHTERQGFCMQKPHPAPEDFWTELSPTALDDPAFRAAATGTVYQPAAAIDPDDDPDDPPTEPFPDPWPGL